MNGTVFACIKWQMRTFQYFCFPPKTPGEIFFNSISFAWCHGIDIFSVKSAKVLEALSPPSRVVLPLLLQGNKTPFTLLHFSCDPFFCASKKLPVHMVPFFNKNGGKTCSVRPLTLINMIANTEPKISFFCSLMLFRL